MPLVIKRGLDEGRKPGVTGIGIPPGPSSSDNETTAFRERRFLGSESVEGGWRLFASTICRFWVQSRRACSLQLR